MEAKAVAKTIRVSPQKARLVVDLVRGKTVKEALGILEYTNKAASPAISKVVKSAAQNAVYNNDAEVTYETTEELKEYEELLKGIVTGARKEDYREAVRKAKEASEKLESEEQNEII